MLEQTNKHSSLPAGKNRGDFLALKYTAQRTQAGSQLKKEETIKRYTKLRNATKVFLFEMRNLPSAL